MSRAVNTQFAVVDLIAELSYLRRTKIDIEQIIARCGGCFAGRPSENQLGPMTAIEAASERQLQVSPQRTMRSGESLERLSYDRDTV